MSYHIYKLEDPFILPYRVKKIPSSFDLSQREALCVQVTDWTENCIYNWVNIPLKDCFIHSPNVLQNKLYKQWLLSLGLSTFENSL